MNSSNEIVSGANIASTWSEQASTGIIVEKPVITELGVIRALVIHPTNGTITVTKEYKKDYFRDYFY